MILLDSLLGVGTSLRELATFVVCEISTYIVLTRQLCQIVEREQCLRSAPTPIPENVY